MPTPTFFYQYRHGRHRIAQHFVRGQWQRFHFRAGFSAMDGMAKDYLLQLLA